ncbi:MAG: DUF6178 family protein [Pseudomonadota bacterium]
MPQNPAPRNASKLVAALLEQPQLPAYVDQMSTPALNNLIQHVGKEDAQELIELTSANQIREIIALDVWESAGPGTEERFAPAKFLEWVYIWQDMGSQFLVEKLHELGSDLFSASLLEYAVVVDIETVGVEGDADVFGNFALLPHEETDWPPLFALLADVWAVDSELLLDVLGRSCLRRSLRSDTTAISSDDIRVREDVTGDRDEQQMQRGFIGPLEAAVMLGDAKSKALDDLLIEVTYDGTSAAHLHRLRRQQTTAAEKKQASVSASRNTSNPTRSVQDEKPGEWEAIETLLASVDIASPDAQVALLKGPERAYGDYLSQHLERLTEKDPTALADRQGELVFLANVLLGGTTSQGVEFSRQEAATAARALCNLGLKYCAQVEAWDTEDVVVASFLESEPGLVKAFRVGYHLVTAVQSLAVASLIKALRSGNVERRLVGNPWLRERVQSVFDSTWGIPEDAEALAKLIESLGMTFDAASCHCLGVLSDPFPGFPLILETEQDTVHVETGVRYINDPKDLEVIGQFLESFRL